MSLSVIIKGLISNKLASFSVKNLYKFLTSPSSWSTNDPDSSKLDAIVLISKSVIPVLGSIKTVVISSGVSSATF